MSDAPNNPDSIIPLHWATAAYCAGHAMTKVARRINKWISSLRGEEKAKYVSAEVFQVWQKAIDQRLNDMKGLLSEINATLRDRKN